jgi:hypothetical protein
LATYNYSDKQLAVLQRLLRIVDNLYLETAGFLDNGDNQQHWYNRGYANGVVQQLDEYGYRSYVEDNIVPDGEDIIAGHEFWAWGKAYQHGKEIGMKETTDVIGPAESDE